MTAATLRNADPEAAENGLTTFSLCCLLRLLPLFQPCQRACWQAKYTDEPLGVFLSVGLAHGERRKIGAVKREFSLASANGYIAFVELQCHGAADFFLCLLNKGVQRFTQRREP